MQQEGYDKLSSDANEALEDTLNALEANANKQEEVVNMMLERLKTNYGDAYAEIQDIISHTGTVVSDTANQSVEQINTAIDTVLENAKIKISEAFSTIADSISQAINTSAINVNSASTQTAENILKNTDTQQTIQNAKNSTTPITTSAPNIKSAQDAVAEEEARLAAEEAARKAAEAAAAAAKKATTTTTQAKTTTALTGPVSGIKGTLKSGSQGSNVKKLQKALNSLGYKASNGKKLQVDGVMGSLTISSLKKFQKAMGVKQTGKLDDATKKAFAKKGYAKGTLRTLEDELNFTHEGEIIRRSDGAILRQLPQGTQVIPKEQSQNLLKWADMTPDFLKNKLEDISTANMSVGVTNHYDSLITINGNVDENVMDRLEDLAKQLLNNRNFKNGTVQMISKEFGREMRKMGM